MIHVIDCLRIEGMNAICIMVALNGIAVSDSDRGGP
jgi:hypothetical protein